MNDRLIKSYAIGVFYTKLRSRVLQNKVQARKRQFMYEKSFLPLQEAHNRIYDLLVGERPAMVCRYGLTEAQIIGKYCMKEAGIIKSYGKCADWLYNTAGFFSANGQRKVDDVDSFARLMIEDSEYVDLIGASYALLEDYDINSFCTKAEVTEFDNLRVMVAENSWGRALEGKKVLVIHPFDISIKSQYMRREQVWKDRADSILPQFELITYKAVQTIAGNNVERYTDWFEALNKMKNDIHNIDFDIAIIGCGAYGFPLAAECKRMGKKAIHLGGQVQMMFGILGKRWEEIPYYKQFINEYWVHPLEEEIPNNYKKVENGCYW